MLIVVYWVKGFMEYNISWSDFVFTGHIYFREGSPVLYVKDNHGNNIAYTTKQQLDILERVQSSYFLGIVFLQAFHIFHVRMRYSSDFFSGLLHNNKVVLGTAIAIGLALCIVYVPYIQNSLFRTQHCIPDAVMAGVLIGIMLIWAYSEFRKYISTSKNSSTTLLKYFSW
jgi:magnesium-transporting ATPase (P-type)